MRALMTRRGTMRNVAYGRFGRELLGVSYLGLGRFWDLSTFEEIRATNEETTGRQLLPWLFHGGGRAFLEANGYWPASDEWPLAVVPRPEHFVVVGSGSWKCFTADGLGFVSAGYGEFVRTDRQVAAYHFPARFLRTYEWREQVTPYRALFTPGGEVLAVYDTSGTRVTLFDGAKGGRLGALDHKGQLLKMAPSPDGRLLATAAWRTVRLWALETREEVWRFAPFKATCEALAFSPDGRLLAGGSREGRVRVWEVASGRELADHAWGYGEVNDLAFSPDGLTCAAACRKKAVVVWDVDV